MRIAIVGSGISGLVCAHLLDPGHDVTVFEAGAHVGGHTNTVPVRVGGNALAVDTGFIVFNERTYPGFCRLLERLGVSSKPSDMSFSVSCERTGVEYATHSTSGLLARPTNALRPGYWRMLRDVPRFQREARALLETDDEKVTLGDFLLAGGYSREFAEQHLIPMGAAIWSADLERFREFPALSFARFFANHGLLARRGQPPWRVVEGGSGSYVRALVARLRRPVRLRTPVLRIARRPGGVDLWTRSGCERFDHAIVAAHSDQALGLLSDPSDAERAVLGAIRYQENDAVLHTDRRALPRARRAWASWNVRVPRGARGRIAVTYHMNRLQGLDAPAELCVTLNDASRVAPHRVLRRIRYHHPIFDADALRAQRERAAIDGVERTHFCGAYWGYGFHEDGLQSALTVARRFGREL